MTSLQDAGESPRGRAFAQAGLAVCALLFCLPWLLCAVLGAGFLDLANEPLAYRFFYPEKVFAGDTVVMGVGHLVSVLHHGVYATMHLFPGIAGASLERRMDVFVLATNGLLSATLCALLWAAARSTRLLIGDFELLGIVVLAPFLATSGWGFEYVLMADYTFLDMVLCTASLLLFQWYWRSADAAPGIFTVIALGAFAGAAAANKPTMLVVAGAALIPAVFARGLGWWALGKRSLLGLAGMLVAFLSVHLASHLGDVPATMAGLAWWWQYVQNAGSEPGFWDALRASMLKYNYEVFAGFGIGALVLAIVGLEATRNRTLRAMVGGTFCMLGFVASAWFVTKRPANSTLFEFAMFVVILGGVLLTMVAEWRPARMAITGFSVAWVLVAVLTFPAQQAYELVAGSAQRSRIKWDAFEETRRIAGPRPIEVVMPDNYSHHEGVFELLIKAASTFPQWKPSPGGKALIFRRYAPGLAVRYTGGMPGPGAPYAGGRVLVWFDLPGAPPLTAQYPELAKAVSQAGVTRHEWTVPRRVGLIYYEKIRDVTMHAAAIP